MCVDLSSTRESKLRCSRDQDGDNHFTYSTMSVSPFSLAQPLNIRTKMLPPDSIKSVTWDQSRSYPLFHERSPGDHRFRCRSSDGAGGHAVAIHNGATRTLLPRARLGQRARMVQAARTQCHQVATSSSTGHPSGKYPEGASYPLVAHILRRMACKQERQSPVCS